MAAEQVRNIAPFINDEFTVVSKWWTERVNAISERFKPGSTEQ